MKARQSLLGRMLFEDKGAASLIIRAKHEHDKRRFDSKEISLDEPLRLNDYIPKMIKDEKSWQADSWKYIQECFEKYGRGF